MYWHLDEGSSVQFSHAVMSNSLWPHGRQASLSITNSEAYSNSCPSSRWCHPAIPSSVISFSCFQSFPASESFPVSQFFTSVRVASNLPDPREWLVILSTGESCLAASGFWSCFGFFPSVWPVSTSASPLVQKTVLLSTAKIYFSLYKVGGVGEKQPFSVPTLSPLSSGNKVLRQLRKLRLWYF